jgi:hypothetical protein
MIRVRSVTVFAVCAIAAIGCRGITDKNEPFKTCIEVKGKLDPAAPGFIVTYKTGVDPVATTKQLETKYGFAATHVYTALGGFSAKLTNSAVVGVSCEPSVASMEHDAAGTIATQ